MLSKRSILRVARPTDNLSELSRMYIDGLGFIMLGQFKEHDGFSGSIIGHSEHSYHLEFTHHKGTTVGKSPTEDNLLVFYVADKSEWLEISEDMIRAGFKKVAAYNPYWDVVGVTFEDIDGYRVVLQNSDWSV
jgi:hypothetical protein